MGPRPQTQGKIERYHQTLKKWLALHDEFDSIDTLQAGVDFLAGYYNEVRPHQAHGRTPLSVYNERDKATPVIDGQPVSPTTNVRRDRVDKTGSTRPARSPCGTVPGSTTSGWGGRQRPSGC